MMQRSWRYPMATLAVLAVLLVGGYLYWNRPSPLPTLEQLSSTDGVSMTRVTPDPEAHARVLLAVKKDQRLSDTQLMTLSGSGSAQIVQVILPDDCVRQGKALQAGLAHLQGPATLVAGIGPGATLAWRWLAEQKTGQVQALSVNLALEKSGCTHLLPQSASQGRWRVVWNDNPDDTSAAFVRNQPNVETTISDYDISAPQLLDSQLRSILLDDRNQSALNMPVEEIPAGEDRDTITLFLSGDGGWRDLDRSVAEEMARLGQPVVGIDTLRYYWQHKSPEQSALDLARVMQHYRQAWGTRHFILAGYSFGADVLPALYNRLSVTDQQQVDAVILLAFARTGSFEIEVQGWLGSAGSEAATGPEMTRLPADKVVCIYGVEEAQESDCTDPTVVGEIIKLPGGHHFDKNYPALAKRLIDEINQRQAKGTGE